MTTKPDNSGLLVIDKPQGVTSHDVVAAVRGALHMKRVGHAGTLDPMATGVLVVGFGNATRLLNYIVDHDKTYLATIRLGQRTTTDDADGELLPEEGTIAEFPSRQTVEDVIAHHFTGRIEQVPNSYSAIKINGQRAYDLAREGKDVDLKARPVTISEFSVSAVRYGYASTTCAGSPLADTIEIAPEESWHAETDGQNEPNMQPVMELDVTVTCSAGTYIRALGRDLGSELGLGGHLTMLRRIRVGRFSVDMPNVMTAHTEAKTFTNREGIEVTRNRAVLDDAEHAVDHALDLVASAAASMDMLPVTEQEATDLRFGRRIAHDIHTTMAAYVPETNDLVAIQAGRGLQLKQSRPACTQYEHDKHTDNTQRRTHEDDHAYPRCQRHGGLADPEQRQEVRGDHRLIRRHASGTSGGHPPCGRTRRTGAGVLRGGAVRPASRAGARLRRQT